MVFLIIIKQFVKKMYSLLNLDRESAITVE